MNPAEVGGGGSGAAAAAPQRNAAAIAYASRGARFEGDKKDIALYIQRSKNGNVVVYDVKSVPNVATGRALDAAEPIDAYWLDIDPAYRAKARAAGKTSDRDELGWLDKWKAYGVSTSDVQAQNATVQFVALPSKATRLTLERDSVGNNYVPMIRCNINGVENCVLERIWVESDESGWFPSVVYIDLFGLHPTTLQPITERLRQ